MKRCPACKTETPAADFLAGLCPTCFAAGTPIPLGPTMSLSTRALVRAGGARTPIPVRPPTLEDAMETKPCPKCGRMFLPAGYGRHVPSCAGKTGWKVRPPRDWPDRPQETSPADAEANFARSRETPAHAGNGHDCAVCPLRGNHAEQDLFTELVRGGLSVPDAVARMVQAKAVYGRLGCDALE